MYSRRIVTTLFLSSSRSVGVPFLHLAPKATQEPAARDPLKCNATDPPSQTSQRMGRWPRQISIGFDTMTKELWTTSSELSNLICRFGLMLVSLGLLTTAFGELLFFFVDLPLSRRTILLFWLAANPSCSIQLCTYNVYSYMHTYVTHDDQIPSCLVIQMHLDRHEFMLY
ncbi:hypothetical protein F4782DRAFT_140544 [Xylaria castorea]|nr:hypothetical protein F4782DRAFT_140544 [Xylaria castorea]